MRTLTADELKLQQRLVLRSAVLGLLVVAIVLAAFYYLVAPGIAFPSASADRLAFALKIDVVLAILLLIAVQRVSSGRYRSAADNQGSAFGPPSDRIAIDAAFLQNTLEQGVIAFIVHLAVAATVTGDALVFIPAACVLFVAGRIAFRVGYPRGAGARAFGMVLTVLPSLFCAILVVWLSVAGLSG